jgi:hypothetical protein
MLRPWTVSVQLLVHSHNASTLEGSIITIETRCGFERVLASGLGLLLAINSHLLFDRRAFEIDTKTSVVRNFVCGFWEEVIYTCRIAEMKGFLSELCLLLAL